MAGWRHGLATFRFVNFGRKPCCQGHQAAAQKRHSPLKAKSSSRCHCTVDILHVHHVLREHRISLCRDLMPIKVHGCVGKAKFCLNYSTRWFVKKKQRQIAEKQRLKAAFFLQIAAESKATRGYKTLTGRLRGLCGLCGRRLCDATKETREATRRLRGCRASSFQKTNVAGMARMARMARGGGTIRTRFDERALASKDRWL